MQHLTLLRHASANGALPGQADFERSLSERGVSEAALVAKRLQRRDFLFDGIMSSPALRARQTAEIFAGRLGLDVTFEDLLYNADEREIFSVVRQLDDKNLKDLLLVGHNPGLTHFQNMMGDVARDNLPTCAVIRMEFSVSHWDVLTANSGRQIYADWPGRVVND